MSTSSVKCDYCGEAAQLVTGKVVYPHLPKLASKKYWVCGPCDARVGCHRFGSKPLGRLANPELRNAKMKAHHAFDPLWKFGGMSRDEAYRLLARLLGIKRRKCHIGLFDVDQCKKVVELCRRFRHEQAMGFAEDFDDMPDGAFFAMADELGLEPEDFCD